MSPRRRIAIDGPPQWVHGAEMTECFDYVIVGGGTAGCVLAARLSEDPSTSVSLLEWGPTDQDEPRALELGRWAEMVESEHDLDYRSVDQTRGNSAIRQSRARILGGCSSHNGMIAFRPLAADLDEWAALGARGWGADSLVPYFDRLACHIVPIAAEHRNPYLADATHAASEALGIPWKDTWNSGPFIDGAGFLELGYHPETGARSSASVAYVHPILGRRTNLEVTFDARATRILTDNRRATGVLVRRGDGSMQRFDARREVVIACGAIDSPRLLMLSGIGPGEDLHRAGVNVVHDLPAVGANLMDHPEGLIIWEAARPLPPQRVMDWDAAILARIDPGTSVPDVLFHIPLVTWGMHAEALGYPTPTASFSMTPNVAKPRSRGRIWLSSPDPEAAPVIDPGYFTDPEGYDERILVAAIRMARRIALHEPLAGWLGPETFPGPKVQDEQELSALVRAASHTVYHVSGTCRMGASHDPKAVVDPALRVQGMKGLRVVDASVFPSLTCTNPVVTVMMLAERAADLIAGRAGPVAANAAAVAG